jgi:hypothetical protein
LNPPFHGFTPELLNCSDEVVILDEEFNYIDEVGAKGQVLSISETSSMLIKPPSCTQSRPAALPLDLEIIGQAKNMMKISARRGSGGFRCSYALDTSTMAMAPAPPYYLEHVS